MSLFNIVNAPLIKDIDQGYQQWLRQSNRERRDWQDTTLIDNEKTRLYWLGLIGFLGVETKPKRSVFERFLDLVS